MSETRLFPVLTDSLEQWMLAGLRGAPITFPANISSAEWEQFLTFTADTGIQPYLFYQLREHGGLALGEAEFAQELQRRYLMERVNARVRKDELQRVMQLFNERALECVVLKGSALVHQIYPEIGLRPSCDIDLFILPHERERAEKMLAELGYQYVTTYSYESQFYRNENQLDYWFDLHWQLSDSVFLSPLFEFRELQARAVLLPNLTANVYGLGAIDALINVCLHLAHHRDFDRLAWLLDVHLLCGRLSEAEFDQFLKRAVQKQCGAICHTALQRTRDVFGTPALQRDLSSLLQNKKEISAYLLAEDRSLLSEYRQQWRVSSWRERWQMIWQTVFPPRHLINPVYYSDENESLTRLRMRRLLKMPLRQGGILIGKLRGKES